VGHVGLGASCTAAPAHNLAGFAVDRSLDYVCRHHATRSCYGGEYGPIVVILAPHRTRSEGPLRATRRAAFATVALPPPDRAVPAGIRVTVTASESLRCSSTAPTRPLLGHARAVRAGAARANAAPGR
jgi:hypothetical protein